MAPSKKSGLSRPRPLRLVPATKFVTLRALPHLVGHVSPSGSETSWRFEYATSAGGPWGVVPGAEGTISQAEAEALPEGSGVGVAWSFTGLSTVTTYYVRLFAENKCAVDCGASTSGAASFKTFGPPTATTFAVHGLHGEALRVMGAVNPGSVLTSGEQTVAVQGAPTGGTFNLGFEGRALVAAVPVR